MHWEDRDSYDWRSLDGRRRLPTKRRNRFPVGSGTLLNPSQEFPSREPKLWGHRRTARCHPLIEIVRKGRESFHTIFGIRYNGDIADGPDHGERRAFPTRIVQTGDIVLTTS